MYKPEFKGVVEGWSVNYVTAQYWRVASTMTRDDVHQEVYLAYLRCVQKCPSCESPKQFMALFKRAVTNLIHDLASLDTRHRPQGQTAGEDLRPGELDNDGYLSVLINEAPEEVKAVLNLFLNAPSELLELALGSWKQDGRKADVRSKKICRMLGLDESVDVLKMVEDHFLN